MAGDIDTWLGQFQLDSGLHGHAAQVLASLPAPVRDDFLSDPGFTLCDYDAIPGGVHHVPVHLAKGRRPGRSVVLKRSLRLRPVAFIQWVIAHELAHAHLRNAGRFPGEDPERAADA